MHCGRQEAMSLHRSQKGPHTGATLSSTKLSRPTVKVLKEQETEETVGTGGEALRRVGRKRLLF